MEQEIIKRFEDKLSKFSSLSKVNDPVLNFLPYEPISDFNSGLRILPLSLVEQFGTQVIQDQSEFLKKFESSFDPFLVDWNHHFDQYWKDKINLLEDYTTQVQGLSSPFEIFNRLSGQMIKIERRAILLKSEVKVVTQKHHRLSGDQKDYQVLRSQWVGENGENRRMISRHVGDRFENMEREIADLFYNRGYAVHRNYRHENGSMFDIVIERERMKSVVEIKMINQETFSKLFLFEELLQRFKQDYPQG